MVSFLHSQHHPIMGLVQFLELRLTVHQGGRGGVQTLPNIASYITKIENGNGECVKETKTRLQSRQKRTAYITGLQCSEKLMRIHTCIIVCTCLDLQMHIYTCTSPRLCYKVFLIKIQEHFNANPNAQVSISANLPVDTSCHLKKVKLQCILWMNR